MGGWLHGWEGGLCYGGFWCGVWGIFVSCFFGGGRSPRGQPRVTPKWTNCALCTVELASIMRAKAGKGGGTASGDVFSRRDGCVGWGVWGGDMKTAAPLLKMICVLL